MVVDHVEKHHQAELVRPVDETLEVVGSAIGRIRRVRQDAVVTPVSAALEIGDREQLDGGDAEIAEILEVPSGVAVPTWIS